MGRTRKELYDLANNFYLNSTIQLVDKDFTYSLYRIEYQDKLYEFCIANLKNNYNGPAPTFYLRNQSENFARNLCWKKLIEPTIQK